ncbi:MarR family transcriptional regulator [Skermanella pratensis]|uniref:MarR family transcriptional regulator n=1 Tax=Skermanella pratensis TaxID=2233999 RepID=UPI001300E284|nr:MarR family transcriptional regulator [Skermanella pratensis]
MTAKTATLRATFGFRLARIARHWRREIDDGLRPYGLTEATWLPLLHLSHMGNEAKQKDLAASLDIEGASLVRLLDALESSGLIERFDHETDRRAKVVRLTARGLDLLDGVNGVAAGIRRRLLLGVLDDEIASTLRIFDRIEQSYCLDHPDEEAQEAKRAAG